MQMWEWKLRRRSVIFDVAGMGGELLACQLEVFVEEARFVYGCPDADGVAGDSSVRKGLFVER